MKTLYPFVLIIETPEGVRFMSELFETQETGDAYIDRLKRFGPIPNRPTLAKLDGPRYYSFILNHVGENPEPYLEREHRSRC